MENSKIVIAGGSGMIGTHLTTILLDQGFEVWWLSRSGKSQPGVRTALWDIDNKKIEPGALDGAHAVLNLAGENIGDGRWTARRKQKIVDSRRDSTRLLGESIANLPDPPTVFIGASASGYYGDRKNEVVTEDSPPGGSGFHSQSVIQIEKAIHDFIPEEIRTVIPRFGVVLSNKGGALPRFTTPLRYGLASYMGNGKQWMSWIHIHDLCRFLSLALRVSTIQGTYNVVAPGAISNKTFVATLRKVYNPLSLIIPVPAWVLRLVLGEMADVVLDSVKIVPERMLQTNFDFHFPDIKSALTHLKTSGD
mgnify:FL=1